MSLRSLANSAIARREDFLPHGTPKTYRQIAAAASTPPVPTDAAAPGAAGAVRTYDVDTALHVLFGYIPTEVLTLYVAVLAALAGGEEPGKPTPLGSMWVAFWIFLCATPVVKWLIFSAKLKAYGKPLPWSPRTWPVWEMVAAAIAFCAWAFALPSTPFAKFSWYSAAVAALALLVASTVLGLLAPLFQNQLPAGSGPSAKAKSGGR